MLCPFSPVSTLPNHQNPISHSTVNIKNHITKSSSKQDNGFRSPKIHNPTRIQSSLISRLFFPSNKNLLLLNHHTTTTTTTTTKPSELRHLFLRSPWFSPPCSAFHSLTDTRFPKRRPGDKPRRKRASLKPPGPYAWVKYVPGEPILPNQSNEGSVKRRNEKKRIKQHLAFIISEKKQRKAQLQEAKREKIMKRVDWKMAAVARDRAWQERLVELQKIEEEKKKAATA